MSFKLAFWTLLTGSRLKAYLLEGDKLLKAGNHLNALEYYRKVQQGWPTRPEGYEGMSRAYHAMGFRLEAQREATIAESMEILKERPDDLPARVEMVKALLEKEMFGWAATHADQAVRLAPRRLDVLRLAARAFRANRNYDKAAQALRQALRLNPLDAELYELLAYILKAGQHSAEAAKAASLAKALKSIQNDPGNVEEMTRAVRQFLAAGQKRLALTLVDGTLKQYPQSAGLFRLRGELLLGQRELKEAVLSLRRALQLSPTDLTAHRLLAKAYETDGQPLKAQHHLRLAATLDKAQKSSDLVEAEVALIRVLLENKQLGEARQRAETLFRSQREDWRAPYVLALVLAAQGLGQQALAFLNRACRLNEKAPETRMEMARIHSAADEVVEAVSEARKAVSLAPRNSDMRFALAQILRKHGYLEQALEEEQLAESLVSNS
jgi:tetratricopeptide (TPR) repeat protein